MNKAKRKTAKKWEQPNRCGKLETVKERESWKEGTFCATQTFVCKQKHSIAQIDKIILLLFISAFKYLRIRRRLRWIKFNKVKRIKSACSPGIVAGTYNFIRLFMFPTLFVCIRPKISYMFCKSKSFLVYDVGFFFLIQLGNSWVLKCAIIELPNSGLLVKLSILYRICWP